MAAEVSSASLKVLICGGGNAAHVLAGKLGADDGIELRWLSTYGDEATRIAATDGELEVANDWTSSAPRAKLNVTNDPAVAVPGADLVVFLVPATYHESYLSTVIPHLTRGRSVTIGAFPGEGGFDVGARRQLDAAGFTSDDITLFAGETLPWACRIAEYGKRVEVLGTKKDVDVAVVPPSRREETLAVLQKLVGNERGHPVLSPTSALAVTLMNINSVWHPTITYGCYRDWDGKPMDEPPPFYDGVDAFTADALTDISDEILRVKAALLSKYPALDLGALRHVFEWMKRAYAGDIEDDSTLQKAINTNKGYRGLVHPCTKTGDGKYLPNWRYRYTSEDVPYGLVVTAGIAQLAGVETPRMNEIIRFGQSKAGKEYVTDDGKVAGKDLESTRAPQRWGYSDLDTFMRDMKYID